MKSVYFDFEKVENFSKIFWEILSTLMVKMVEHKTPNFETFRKFVNKNSMKHWLLDSLFEILKIVWKLIHVNWDQKWFGRGPGSCSASFKTPKL